MDDISCKEYLYIDAADSDFTGNCLHLKTNNTFCEGAKLISGIILNYLSPI